MGINEGKNRQPVIDSEIFPLAAFDGDGRCCRCLLRYLGARFQGIGFRFISRFASVFSAHGCFKVKCQQIQDVMSRKSGTLRLDNAYLAVGCRCIMQYAI